MKLDALRVGATTFIRYLCSKDGCVRRVLTFAVFVIPVEVFEEGFYLDCGVVEVQVTCGLVTEYDIGVRNTAGTMKKSPARRTVRSDPY